MKRQLIIVLILMILISGTSACQKQIQTKETMLTQQEVNKLEIDVKRELLKNRVIDTEDYYTSNYEDYRDMLALRYEGDDLESVRSLMSTMYHDEGDAYERNSSGIFFLNKVDDEMMVGFISQDKSVMIIARRENENWIISHDVN